MSQKDLPPVPPEGRSNKGPGGRGDSRSAGLSEDATQPRRRNIDKQGRQGKLKVNTINQGYQQDR